MKKGMKSAFAATLALTACFGGISTYAAFDENLNVYTLDAVVVEAGLKRIRQRINSGTRLQNSLITVRAAM